MVSFVGLPPEINSLRMLLGAGSGPMLAAAAAWNGLAEELGSAASSFSSVTSNLTGQAWQGPAASGQANAVASAFETAKSAMINPEAIAANRNAFVQLVRSNFLGLNGPMIAAAEGIYEEFWAADVAAMFGYYGGASAAAEQLSSWQQALQGLPVIGGLFGSGASAAAVGSAADEAPNYGAGNKGGGNIGAGNNSDSADLAFLGITGGIGAGNNGFGNFGSGNTGSGNLGIQNIGAGNLGEWNLGKGNLGDWNIGSGNLGDANVLGWGNLGNGNHGIANTGDFNQGFGNTGNNNIGFGLTGDHLIGVGGAYYDQMTGQFHFDGNSGTGNLGLFNSGTNNIGFFNSGDGNVGLFSSGANVVPEDFGKIQSIGIGNAGVGNIGFFNAGDANVGTSNAGSLNTGWGNAGSGNTGNGNSGVSNTGNFNSGDLNTGSFFNIDGPLESSGYGNNGPAGMSGFGNTVSDDGLKRFPASGFYNTFQGGTDSNGNGSGWFNTGVPTVFAGDPPGSPTVSGLYSGLFNTGSFVAGYFDFVPWLKGLVGQT
ncbi:PPE domain-containing protein [Mycobacterium sp.]|uniref:PPE family protein n=1 Tax=Mycobacterium sp. TaxID=1785 RepID=UPI003A860031